MNQTMAYRDPHEKLVKGRPETYGPAYSKGQRFKAPYSSDMGQDPIRGSGIAPDMSDRSMYRKLADPSGTGWSVENSVGFETESRRLPKGRR
jgi:hypothetical protein